MLQQEGASVGRVAAAPHSPKTCITFTNTYINTLHTIASLGGRLPHRGSADTVTCLRNSRKGRRAPREMGSMCFLLPRESPPSPPRLPRLPRSGFSLSSMESCRRQVWRLATWAAVSWAGCADRSRSEHPAEDGGAAAAREPAGGPAGCAGTAGARTRALLQGPGARWSPRPRAGRTGVESLHEIPACQTSESCCRQTRSYQGGQRCSKSPTLLCQAQSLQPCSVSVMIHHSHPCCSLRLRCPGSGRHNLCRSCAGRNRWPAGKGCWGC